MANPIELIIDKIDLGSIIMSLSPPVIGLEKSDLILFLNGIEFQDYNIFDDSEGLGKVYNIIPYHEFNPQDSLDIQIIRSGLESDKIKIVFAKAFHDSTAEIYFKLPITAQGEYIIKLMTVNERTFDINSESIVVSRPIDGESSYADLDESKVYFLDDNFNIDIGLVTIDGTNVPDGKYEIIVD